MKKNSNITWLSTLALMLTLLIFSEGAIAQVDKERLATIRESEELLSDASIKIQKEEFIAAEADYRKAIALNPEDKTGKYNLATAYYGKDKNAEAMQRFKQAATAATKKLDKHKAFHNLGNTYMNEKKYTEAVEAFKNALRNNPTDDETRYNLALAKDMLDKNPPQNDGGDDDKNKDENKDEENKDKKDDGDKKEGDDGDQKEEKDKGDKEDENKEGDNEEDKGKPEDPKDEKEGKGDKPQQQEPVPGKLSPQQVKNLLEAMNNEEKKVQDKINAQKQKGSKVKAEKDW